MTDDQCIIWPFGTYKNGYGQMGKDGKKTYAHRVVCEMVHGPAPSAEHQAAHRCGNGHKGCVSPAHLRWATRSENAQDRLGHQIERVGIMPGAILTTADVRAIRVLEGVLPCSRIAGLFGVTPANVQRIHRRLSWKWLE